MQLGLIPSGALALTCLLTFAGCGDDGDADGGTGGSSNTGGSTGTGGGGGAPLLVSATGTILDGFSNAPMEGAEVCVIDPPDLGCATTGADGTFLLEGVPGNTRIRATASKDKYFPTLGVFDVGTENAELNASLLTQNLIVAAYSAIGVDFDLELGAVAFIIQPQSPSDSVAGWSGALTPAAGEGPYYLVGTALSATATETAEEGTGNIINVPPGDYTLNMTGPGYCLPTLTASDAPGTYVAPVMAGHLTAIALVCEDN